jgi:hypothetical protein
MVTFLTTYCGMTQGEAASLSEAEAGQVYNAKIQEWMSTPDLAPKRFKRFVQSSRVPSSKSPDGHTRDSP